MAEFKVEKDVPLPKLVRRVKYPFREMEVGDSFFYEGGQKSIHTAASKFCRDNPEYKFTTRQVEEGGVKGVRVWRINAKTESV